MSSSTVLPVPGSSAPTAELPPYAELHCLSSFSFQRGASQPEELVERAHRLGYSALAITDECSVAGMVRAHGEAQRCGLKLLPGAEFRLQLDRPGATPDSAAGLDGTLVVLAHELQGWGNLCQCITAARRAAPKGQYRFGWDALLAGQLASCELLFSVPAEMPFERAVACASRLRRIYGESVWLALDCSLGGVDALAAYRLRQLSQLTGVPLVAVGNVHMHARSRKPLHDVLTAVRVGRAVQDCGQALLSNAERHLRTRTRIAALYPAALLAATVQIAARCHFNLGQLRYQYPQEAVLPGHTPAQTLHQHTQAGAVLRYPQGVPDSVQAQIAHELALIAELRYEMYFLTVHDLVRFARSRGILCQGRGSAANSAVCYCLGITEVDPSRSNVLFERFISRERDEPPDIDVDFEHQRREEVIQYIYAKYGRARAALTAVVTSYRPRSALRDVGRALGIAPALVDALSHEHPGMYGRVILADRLASALARLGAAFVAPSARLLQLWLDLSHQLLGFPRHLSQHVGGFVLTQGPLTRLVPVENAAMPERSVIQWDKDDLDAVGLLKVDVLALGMLSAIRRCLTLVGQWRGKTFQMQDIPGEDVATYDMICQADTVGVFQIESRAQMSMLPRLRPRCFYDLVVEVAIVRPGPIQGGMVHPYLQARARPADVRYPSAALEAVLKRTLGVPIFQEQVMQVAMAAADFSAGEADQLRRSMAAWKRKGGVQVFYERLVGGMRRNGYSQAFAEQLFAQIEGFGEYGFPESHAASFALLVYVSCWLKRHEPACFLAAMLNSQPMGFYGPSQLVRDAQQHGVTVHAVDVMFSDWDCTLETPGATPAVAASAALPVAAQPSVRLGLCMVSGLAQAPAQRIVAGRSQASFTSVEDMALRCGLDAAALAALSGADALRTLSGHRRQQAWAVSAWQPATQLLRGVPIAEAPLYLPAAPEGEEVVRDYAATGLTLRAHPLQLLRPQLQPRRLLTAAQTRDYPSGRLVRVCGLVTMRQQPQTAKGVIFVTLEDESGSVNVIVWKAVKQQFRDALYRARLLAVYGIWQRDDASGGNVRHVVARRLVDLSDLLGDLSVNSRDFH